MKTTNFTEDCINCMLNRYLNSYPDDASSDKKTKYMKKVMEVLTLAPSNAKAPELVAEIVNYQEELFGQRTIDYTEVKKEFNSIMLSLEEKLSREINNSPDPVRLAIGYAMTGNYIDFGAVSDVNENQLYKLLDNAKDISVSEEEISNLKKDVLSAKKLVYLTDNCGEVVLDKILIRCIKELNPSLDIKVIVRGYPALNDVTIEDALQVGLDKICPVMGNGSDIAGTSLDKICADARNEIDTADVIIAKGMGNFETLFPCGKNVYYMFMCKCKMFARLFDVPLYTNMLANDLRS